MFNLKNYYYLLFAFVILLGLNCELFSQHRGDNLSFQGLTEENGIGVKTAAMGGASIANLGDLSSIFSNPAGLAGIKTYKISFAANKFEKNWWENQDYRPNRQFVNLSFYLDGLYTPNPENNGKWDNQAFFNDSTYIVRDPKLGLDPFSKEASNWNNSESDFIFNNFVIAVPFQFENYSFVLSGAYSRQNNILDYDRNTTYLDPHIGYNGYGPIEERVTSADDSVRVNWFDYTRAKKGHMEQFAFGLASEVTEYLNLGFKVNFITGSSDDFYALNKIGYFDLMGGANSFKFSYDTLNTSIKGRSNYSTFRFSLGTVIKLNRITIGLNVNLPYTLKKESNYQKVIYSVDSSTTTNILANDKMEIPWAYSIGISFNPVNDFRLAFDLEKSNYSNAEFSFTQKDSTQNMLPNQTTIRIGTEYKVFDFLTLLGGYRNKTALFIPDGAAIKDKGPNFTSYTVGISLNFSFGIFDFAYETTRMRYYDSYFSNTNYNTQTYKNLLFGYTFSF